MIGILAVGSFLKDNQSNALIAMNAVWNGSTIPVSLFLIDYKIIRSLVLANTASLDNKTLREAVFQIKCHERVYLNDLRT